MASTIRVYIENTPKLRNPIMVCGLPDSGNVAKLVIEQLVKQLRAEKFAEIYSTSLPPRVRILEDGTADVPKHSMFFWKGGNGRDIVLYTGDAQPVNPDAAYALADKALEIGQSLGVDTVLTVGAYITGEFSGEPKVFGTGTDKELLGELNALGVSQISEGSVTWMNGLLVGLSKLRNMKAIFISGETSGYIVDARAARAVLRVLSRKLDIPLDLTELDLKAKESDDLVKSIGAMKGRAEKNEKGYIG
ncbi:MAG: PAC2 family protein [Candidatus Bathyarchaeia archaeon]